MIFYTMMVGYKLRPQKDMTTLGEISALVWLQLQILIYIHAARGDLFLLFFSKSLFCVLSRSRSDCESEMLGARALEKSCERRGLISEAAAAVMANADILRAPVFFLLLSCAGWNILIPLLAVSVSLILLTLHLQISPRESCVTRPQYTYILMSLCHCCRLGPIVRLSVLYNLQPTKLEHAVSQLDSALHGY